VDVEVILEWRFSPPDCFEQAISLSATDYSLALEDGSARATLNPTFYDQHPEIKNVLDESVRSQLAGAELVTHRPYTLSPPSVTRVHDNGTRQSFVELSGSGSIEISGRADVQVVDSDGNVTFDSRQERIEAKREFVDLVSKYRATDATLSSMLGSFDTALRDCGNELVHLYEIRDALVTRFGSEGLELVSE
jgi:hypothetical protein